MSVILSLCSPFQWLFLFISAASPKAPRLFPACSDVHPCSCAAPHRTQWLMVLMFSSVERLLQRTATLQMAWPLWQTTTHSGKVLKDGFHRCVTLEGHRERGALNGWMSSGVNKRLKTANWKTDETTQTGSPRRKQENAAEADCKDGPEMNSVAWISHLLSNPEFCEIICCRGNLHQWQWWRARLAAKAGCWSYWGKQKEQGWTNKRCCKSLLTSFIQSLLVIWNCSVCVKITLKSGKRAERICVQCTSPHFTHGNLIQN